MPIPCHPKELNIFFNHFPYLIEFVCLKAKGCSQRRRFKLILKEGFFGLKYQDVTLKLNWRAIN